MSTSELPLLDRGELSSDLFEVYSLDIFSRIGQVVSDLLHQHLDALAIF